MARQNLVGPVPEHEHGADCHEQIDHRLELGLERSVPDARLDALLVLALEARLLVILAREGLHDADRRQHLLSDGGHRTLPPSGVTLTFVQWAIVVARRMICSRKNSRTPSLGVTPPKTAGGGGGGGLTTGGVEPSLGGGALPPPTVTWRVKTPAAFGVAAWSVSVAPL